MPPAAETVLDEVDGEEGPGAGRRGPGIRPRGPLAPAVAAPLAASLLTAGLLCLATALSRTYPFGPVTRNIVDLGQQYLPYHAYWRALLLGETHGDAFLNWNSGFGSNFLGDIGTYLSSPFDLLVVVFPADRIELALYVVTAAKVSAAGAAAALLLLRLRPGPWPVAAVLGTAYALSGWTLNLGTTVPMWLDGLVAFPLLCLVGEWARTGRRPVLGPVVVALAWIANFYTAYMATLGAAVFLAVRLLTAEESATARQRIAGALRAARGVLVGIGLAAPLVVIVFLATKVADPTPVTTFAPAPWADVLARLLPGTAGVADPALFIGTPALALALTLPFNGAVAPRVRAGWTAAVVLVTLSLQWEPTHLLWHAGASPNGAPYRQTFVLCGLLLVAAWFSVARGVPRPAALLGGGALLGALAWAARGSAGIDAWTFPAFLVAAALALAAAVLAREGARRNPVRALPVGALPTRALPTRSLPVRALPVLALVLFVGAQAGETVVTGKRIEEQQRSEVSWSPRIGPWHTSAAREVARADAWPRYRTDPGEVPGGNDVLIVGGQGAEAYSSLTADVTSSTLSALGFGSYAKGRHPVTLDNPVTDALFSIGTRLRSEPTEPVRQDAPPRATVTVTTTPVPPLVTVRPRPARAPRPGDSAFVRQELLLGAPVYALPPETRRTGRTLTARCPAGSDVWFWAPEYKGSATLAGEDAVDFEGKPPAVRAPMRALGTVPASGEVRIDLLPKAGIRLPRQPVGCLDRARLDAAVRQLTATGATRVSAGGHSLTAELPPGSTGVAVLAAPRISGWRCAAGDADLAPARAYQGLVAVPLDGRTTTVACSFRPPGLRLGGAVGAAALLALAATAILHRRSRRTGSRPAESRRTGS
ncbi:YfhO family protein [Streptomyces sp. NBC_00094]|uniref:YfhO family protein n=1 Tax=Streptomyces sp. NBC_00094 TaxID=2903620 RepID=UPI00225AF359|nr:YfhO family protein [Streptomyces sp. NBC_00094]MCX5393687.1 YfhO family protein [Streptomyces sp. NBC_00094]